MWRTHSGTSGLRDLPHRPACLEHELGHEAFQVGEDEEVRLVAGRERSEVAQAVPLGRVERGHDERVLRCHACRDRRAHHRVDVALLGDVLRLAVVGAEGEPVRAELVDERQQRVEVAGARSLADQQPHPRAQPLAALLDRAHLVVGADPGRRVRVQRLAEDGTAHGRRRASRREARASPARLSSPRRRRGSSSSPPARSRACAAAVLRGRPAASGPARRLELGGRARTTRP